MVTAIAATAIITTTSLEDGHLRNANENITKRPRETATMKRRTATMVRMGPVI